MGTEQGVKKGPLEKEEAKWRRERRKKHIRKVNAQRNKRQPFAKGWSIKKTARIDGGLKKKKENKGKSSKKSAPIAGKSFFPGEGIKWNGPTDVWV